TVKLTKTPVHVQDMIQKIIADLDIAFEHQVPINFEHPPINGRQNIAGGRRVHEYR
ncbi:MAG: hypothetical protein HN521_13965, partial [Candidatus Latescibacteria bacterium]|nr:hypothetical protein [Candidatus Latescibacterota bacterium]